VQQRTGLCGAVICKNIIKLLKNLIGKMFVQVRHGRFSWSLTATKMFDVPRNATQTVGYVSDRVRMTQVTEKHADQVCPAINSFAVLIGAVLVNNIAKQFSWN
jgi:hypothetical protein